MTRRWLVLRLEAPLVSFGGVTIDNFGVTRDFPALSMLTGLFANALGWDRTEVDLHQALQDRLIMGARRDREPYIGVLRDTQNAKLGANDEGWTTRGAPEGRRGGADTYKSPHRRQRDYHPDALATVVVTLADGDGPTLDELAIALDFPARPIFFGRKPCLPSTMLLDPHPDRRFFFADNARAALAAVPRLDASTTAPLRATWPASESGSDPANIDRGVSLADIRTWRMGLHTGTRAVVEGRVSPPQEPSS